MSVKWNVVEIANKDLDSRLRLGVNFINILRKHFSYESKLTSFSLITFDFEIFWHQNIGKKVAHKMLMKFTPEECK